MFVEHLSYFNIYKEKQNMGQCVSVSSVRKDPNSEHKYFQPSLQNFLVSSPLKEKPLTVEFSKFDHVSRTSSYSYGVEKEAFFDTQPWLDSDCEDDFYSINGDFTPSRGNTPLHHSFASPAIRRSPHCYSCALASPVLGSSSVVRKKSLSELFEESGRYVTEALEESREAGVGNEYLPASSVSSPYIVEARSSNSGQKTPVGNLVRKVRSFKCCFPQLVLSQSFSERKGS